MQELERLLSIMRSLRDPETGCPWDKQQTIQSIKGFTLEEVYEVVDAIERNNMHDLCDELGDLLFHIVFYAKMAEEEKAFNFFDVVRQVNEKLERRHPHVFSDAKVDNVQQVKDLWEEIKQQERHVANKENAEVEPALLDDISKNMPAIQRAVKLQKRAASVGFDWSDSAEILDKIEEELQELREALDNKRANKSHITEELGDLLFCCINLARHYRIDPELALRDANEKFVSRFGYIEEALRKEDKTLQEASLEEMDALWDEAKLKLT